jgi:predicted  nucleic acid-binding Zn-ribbon protein
MAEFADIYLTIEKNYNSLRSVSEQTQEKSNLNELKLREIGLEIKEKDYKISSLQSELKQIENKGNSREEQLRRALAEV